jgi:hypothetical protein
MAPHFPAYPIGAPVDRPEFRAARQRTHAEEIAVANAILNAKWRAVARAAQRMTTASFGLVDR